MQGVLFHRFHKQLVVLPDGRNKEAKLKFKNGEGKDKGVELRNQFHQ